MILLVSAFIVAAALAWGALAIVSELKTSRADARPRRLLELLQVFAPARGAAAADPKAILVWEPLARAGRHLFPVEFTDLDRAFGDTFPFGAQHIQAAHAQWTADWLAWERAHDATYKLKAAEVEARLQDAPDDALARARLESVEREKLDLYQRKYQEYVQVGKALQAFLR